MVGVFDPVSFLSGYIDPNNSSVFAVYNADKPASLDTSLLAGGVNPNGGAADVSEIVSVCQVRSSTVVPLLAAATIDINCRLGQIFTLSPTSATAISATNVDAGASIYLIVTSNGTSYNVTFNGGTTTIYDAGALATGTDATKRFIIHFIADGSRWYEVSRTGALSA